MRRLSAAQILGRRIVMRRGQHFSLSALVFYGVASREALKNAQQPGSRDFRLRCALRGAQAGGWWARQIGMRGRDRHFFERRVILPFVIDKEARRRIEVSE